MTAAYDYHVSLRIERVSEFGEFIGTLSTEQPATEEQLERLAIAQVVAANPAVKGGFVTRSDIRRQY